MTTADPAVVIGIGGDSVDACSLALTWGAAEAQRRGRPIHLVHGSQPAPMLVEPEAAIEARRRAGPQALAAARRLLESLVGADVNIRTTNSRQPAVDALLAAAETASVIVVQRTFWEHVSSSSVTEWVAARASCPVVVVQTEPVDVSPSTERISLPVVVGIDVDGRAAQALLTAAEEATGRDVSLTALQAWQVPMDDTAYFQPDSDELKVHQSRSERELAEETAGLHDRYPDLDLVRITVRSPAGDALVAASEHAQLVVVARHMTSAMTWRALGATTRNVLRHSHCPVCVTNDTATTHLRRHDRAAARRPTLSPT